MATYAVTERLSGGRPRRSSAAARAAAERTEERPTRVDDDRDAPPEPATVDLVGWDPWLRASELWRQTTFYLFDPEGWR